MAYAKENFGVAVGGEGGVVVKGGVCLLMGRRR
jgi:hypothetical protein